ncbi:hypothetical protein APV28_0121 [Comamonas testosteroni]|nr:hypothetical protein APV28_0121 [Comamonas testosteroni]
MKTKWQSPGYGAKRAFQHERTKTNLGVFFRQGNAEVPMTLWLERRDRVRAGSNETERESISTPFPCGL